MSGRMLPKLSKRRPKKPGVKSNLPAFEFPDGQKFATDETVRMMQRNAAMPSHIRKFLKARHAELKKLNIKLGLAKPGQRFTIDSIEAQKRRDARVEKRRIESANFHPAQNYAADETVDMMRRQGKSKKEIEEFRRWNHARLLKLN